MLISKLDIINSCFKSMGEAPINSLDHSNELVASALQALEEAHATELSHGWYFNTERIELKPQIDGTYPIPADALGLTVSNNPPWMSIRSRKVYDNRFGRIYTGTHPLPVVLIRNIAFEDMPYHAQNAVRYKTVMLFQSAFDGDKQTDAANSYGEARALLKAEHIRAVRANMLHQGGVGSRQHSIHYLGNSSWRR